MTGDGHVSLMVSITGSQYPGTEVTMSASNGILRLWSVWSVEDITVGAIQNRDTRVQYHISFMEFENWETCHIKKSKG
jgi:phosphosulfolactate phosphohydrolase-like enzyme